MNSVAVRCENVSKIYKLYNSPRERLKEALSLFGRKYHKEFYAVQNLSFTLEKGDTLGIIGNNGSGKSTLLQIIAGVLAPSEGKVVVNGRISALLELGAGFNPEFTGIENVYMQGTLMGFTREEMDLRVDGILSFADIGEFIHHPVKTYSSGMFVRLAFSVATQIEPEILIVDEALSVGDMFFQAKSMRKMRQMIENEGVTLLFVSHDLASVKALCNKAILIENGNMQFLGDATTATDKYFALSVKEQRDENESTDRSSQVENLKVDTNCQDVAISDRNIDALFAGDEEFEKKASFQRIQNGQALFNRVILLDLNGTTITNVDYDQNVMLRMALTVTADVDVMGVGYRIINTKGLSIVGSNSDIEHKNNLIHIKSGEKYIVDWYFTVRLGPGPYSIASTCYIPRDMRSYDVEYCDMIPISYQFVVNRRNDCDINAYSYWDNQLNIKKIV